MRRILLALICFFFIIIEPVCVYAHPGRTDGSGGHYNRSTGEYHYHHGYGEHQHSDIDGDGDLDCPYDYNVKTYINPSYDNEDVEIPFYYVPDITEPTVSDIYLRIVDSETEEIDYKGLSFLFIILAIYMIGNFVAMKQDSYLIKIAVYVCVSFFVALCFLLLLFQ